MSLALHASLRSGLAWTTQAVHMGGDSLRALFSLEPQQDDTTDLLYRQRLPLPGPALSASQLVNSDIFHTPRWRAVSNRHETVEPGGTGTV